MSKASEWAALDKQMRCPISDRNEARAVNGGVSLTYFDSSGNISQQIAYSPEEVLKLARWILDTFGETP